MSDRNAISGALIVVAVIMVGIGSSKIHTMSDMILMCVIALAPIGTAIINMTTDWFVIPDHQ